MLKTNKKIILASASPRRKELLKKIFNEFEILVSSVDEAKIGAKTPKEFAVKAAIAKALDIASKSKNSTIIGADTIVVLGNNILGKPKGEKDAFDMLRSLSGTTHEVITGIAVVDPDTLKVYSDFEVTKVTMKKLTDEQISDYIATGKPMDKAGAYGIQELGDPFIENIEGDYDNVVGLPVGKLKELISNFQCPISNGGIASRFF